MFTQVPLPYAYDALEPYIDALTVETHYAKHHATYTANFNKAVEMAGLQNKNIIEILSNLEAVADPAVRTALKNNGGGFYNHNLYFSQLSPNPANQPCGKLAEKIDSTFGSFDNLKAELTRLALGQFGSGWAWLSANKNGDLMISASPNQDNPISEKTGYIPILALDVWEHAYYLKYKNLRADYINSLFNLIDWNTVSANYDAIIR
ncbi:MAG: superoxide dismutase [Oscillospiraceae bacterium]|nr:superoxide dismutase [Oscillospiraceae bacterium]